MEQHRRALWVDEEVQHFLEGPTIPAFACLCLSLGPYVIDVENGGPTRAKTFAQMFE